MPSGERHTRLEKAKEFLQTHGVLRTAHRCAYSAIKHYHPYMTMSCLAAKMEELRLPAETLDYEARFLDEGELLQFARVRALSAEGLTEPLIPALTRNGDKCFGILDQGRLVAFAWYAVRSPARMNDLWALEFAGRSVYLYFVYTHPQYRGRRLFAHGVKLASKKYAEDGYEHLVAFVEWANYSSLAAFRRMGFQEFGRMRITRAFGRDITLGGRGCERFGFRVVRNPNPLTAVSRATASANNPV